MKKPTDKFVELVVLYVIPAILAIGAVWLMLYLFTFVSDWIHR